MADNDDSYESASPRTTSTAQTRPLVHRQRSSGNVYSDRDDSTATTTSAHSRTHLKKQFVARHGHHHVHGHGHARVPSHGERLNKLGGAGGSSARLHATSPKDRQQEQLKRRQRAKFSIGTSDDEKETEEEIEEEEQRELQPPQSRRRDSRGKSGVPSDKGQGKKLQKSSSARSLERKGKRESQQRRERAGSGGREQELRRQEGRAQSSDVLSSMGEDVSKSLQMSNLEQPQFQQVQQQYQAGQERPPSPPYLELRVTPTAPQPQAHPTSNIAPNLRPQFAPQARPLSPQDSGDPVTGTTINPQHTTRQPLTRSNTQLSHMTPVTPAHSLPSSQEKPLTSRFLHTSPSSGAESTVSRRTDLQFMNSTSSTHHPQTPPHHQPQPVDPTHSTSYSELISPPPLNRSDSTYATSNASGAPSRTQKKLWLQHASSQHELPTHSNPHTPQPGTPGGAYGLYPHHAHPHGRTQKDIFDCIAREYRNVRRFKNPLVEGLQRINERERGKGVSVGGSAGRPGSQEKGVSMGLSRSLQDRSGGVSYRAQLVRNKGDSSVQEERGHKEIQAVLKKMWVNEDIGYVA